MSKTRKTLWLSYDLGIDGDYDRLYKWLDELGAVECGDGLCSFKFDLEADEQAPEIILKEIKRRKVKLREKDRLYLIWRTHDHKVMGKFICGERRNGPWTGYAVVGADGTDEESDDGAK
jgi:hypothetical protein